MNPEMIGNIVLILQNSAAIHITLRVMLNKFSLLLDANILLWMQSQLAASVQPLGRKTYRLNN